MIRHKIFVTVDTFESCQSPVFMHIFNLQMKTLTETLKTTNLSVAMTRLLYNGSHQEKLLKPAFSFDDFL